MVMNKAAPDVDNILRDIEALSQTKFLPIIGPVKGKYLAETII